MSDNNEMSPYFFTVEIDGIETARFQKCEGLEAETSIIEIEEGGYGTHTNFQDEHGIRISFLKKVLMIIMNYLIGINK